MALIGSVVNQGSMQGQINEANGNLTGLISSAELIGGQVVGMRGLKGDKGGQGDPGADGADGADGFSPIANVSKVGDTATITITDENGTTTASVSDGQNGAFVVHFYHNIHGYGSDKTAEEIYDAHADGLDVIGILELNDGFHVLALSLAYVENTNPVCKFSVIESPYTSDNVHIDFVELTVDNDGVTDSGSYTKYVPPTTRKINNKNLASDITLTASDVGAQETLVSGTNIKTINNVSLLGSGDISVGGGGGSTAFIAEYGVTTYADVKDAYDEDAIILCTVDDSGNTVICHLAYYDDANDLFYFAQPQSDGFYLAIISSDDTWDDSYFQFASTDTATQLRNGLMDALDKQKLDGIASGAEVNVQSDWNQSVNTADDYIKNKPTIPSKTSDLNNDSGFITGITSTSTPTANEVAEFDSNAHMNSEDMSSQDVDDFVASLDVTAINAVDYVVEQGTSGIWRYRKWNSGYMEATLRMSDPTIGSATTLNGVQRMPINYPTPPTFNTITDVTASGHNSGAWVSAGFDGGGSVVVFLMRISGNTNALSNFSMSLKGTWK